jgi:putative oxidoreductase
MIARTNDVALLAARLAVAALFLPAGIGKLFGLSGFAASLAGKGVPFPELLATRSASPLRSRTTVGYLMHVEVMLPNA